jgi:hypothetical protein
MGIGLTNYDASQTSGIKFWMKSDVPVVVDFGTPATTPADQSKEGTCRDSATEQNCYRGFSFVVDASANAWVERTVPFAALRQAAPFHGGGNLLPGSARWDPSNILDLSFGSVLSAFDFWIDDIRFYSCQGQSCLPSCSADSVACPASGARPADCWPLGTDCSAPPERNNLWGVWGSGPRDVWIVGNSTTLAGTMLHWNGAVWSADASSMRPPMFAVWGNSPTDTWAMGDQGTVLHGNGSTWLPTASGTTSTFNGIWGSDPDSVWVIEFPGTMRHLEGTTWSTGTNAAPYLSAVWGSGPRDIWAVGQAIVHWDGSAWSTAPDVGHPLFGVWGSSTRDVWAVGGAGAIVHWNGSAWLAFPGDTRLSLNGVWGAGPSDIWAVGDYGTIVHWNGLAWRTFPSGTKQRLNAVWGSGSNDVWAVCYNNAILHWDGAVWSPSSL